MESEVKKEKFNWFTMFWEGFTGMSKLGRTLWIIVIVKLIIMFAILKLFFFPNFLKQHFSSDAERSDYIINSITNHTSK